MEEIIKKLSEIVDAPEFMVPWLDRFYESAEMALLMELPRHWITLDRIEKRLTPNGDASRFIRRAWKRGVLERDDQGRYRPADFHTRYDLWAVFEGFKDLPDEIRDQLNQWELQHYIKNHNAQLEAVQKSQDPDAVDAVTPRYLLMDEAMAVLDQVDSIYLWPCNCRSMIQGCSKPVHTCLRFDNNRDIGFEISREKAKSIVRDANKKGLMQSGELGRDRDGKIIGAICNCCSDCCFPHLLSKERGAEKVWPFSRYLAQYHEDRCSYCGLCSKRCPFDAITFQRKSREKAAFLSLNGDLCKGCGVCATACPEEAIEMVALAPFIPLPL